MTSPPHSAKLCRRGKGRSTAVGPQMILMVPHVADASSTISEPLRSVTAGGSPQPGEHHEDFTDGDERTTDSLIDACDRRDERGLARDDELGTELRRPAVAGERVP